MSDPTIPDAKESVKTLDMTKLVTIAVEQPVSSAEWRGVYLLGMQRGLEQGLENLENPVWFAEALAWVRAERKKKEAA